VGPHILAGLLGCPVFFVVCLKLRGRHHIFYEHFADKVGWTRATRDEVVKASAQKFAQRLEHHCTHAPLQWFNFYPFWAT
jgi:predicted LPLAT superfamily acyltransferase